MHNHTHRHTHTQNQVGQVFHPTQDRILSVREYARSQVGVGEGFDCYACVV